MRRGVKKSLSSYKPIIPDDTSSHAGKNCCATTGKSSINEITNNPCIKVFMYAQKKNECISKIKSNNIYRNKNYESKKYFNHSVKKEKHI